MHRRTKSGKVYPRVCGGTCQRYHINEYTLGLSPRLRGALSVCLFLYYVTILKMRAPTTRTMRYGIGLFVVSTKNPSAENLAAEGRNREWVPGIIHGPVEIPVFARCFSARLEVCS